MAVTPQEAIAAARRCVSGDQWLLMSPSEQARVIYREMRQLDLEQAVARGTVHRPAFGSAGRGNADRSGGAGGQRLVSNEPQAALCRAPVRTRLSGQCAWRAMVILNGVPYCGSHARR